MIIFVLQSKNVNLHLILSRIRFNFQRCKSAQSNYASSISPNLRSTNQHSEESSDYDEDDNGQNGSSSYDSVIIVKQPSERANENGRILPLRPQSLSV